MRTPIKVIWKVEMIKLVKRKDYLALLGILAIGILFATSILSDSYEGPHQQSALFWIVTQVSNASILFVCPIIMAFISSRTLAAELESGNISLLNTRVRNRKNIYLGKSLAVACFSVVLFIVTVLMDTILYYLMAAKSNGYASGKFFDTNTELLLCTLLAFFLFAYYFIAQYSLFLGAFVKPAISIGIAFFTVLLIQNTYKVPILKYLNPWYYVITIANDVISTTEAIGMSAIDMGMNVMKLLLLCIIYTLIFNLLAICKLKRKDL